MIRLAGFENRPQQDDAPHEPTTPLSGAQTVPLSELESLCVNALSRFLSGKSTNDQYGLELFRRALVDKDEDAWHALMRVYSKLVHRWVVSHPRYGTCVEEATYYANCAFERLWRYFALDGSRFTKFSNLPKLLRFFKLCTHSAVCDDGLGVAMPGKSQQALDMVEEQVGFATTLETAELQAHHFWRIVDKHLKNSAERATIYGYFYYGMKNREIYQQHRDLFRDAKQVSSIRINVLRRLVREPALKEIAVDFFGERKRPNE